MMTHAIWIQFDQTDPDVSCKWVQFVNNHEFNAQGSEVDDFVSVGYKYYRATKRWYADVRKDERSPWYEPSQVTGNAHSIWDQPAGHTEEGLPKAVMNFQSCLICRSAKCNTGDP